MLAQGGRRVGWCIDAAGELDGRVDGAERAAVGVAAVDEHVAGFKMRAVIQVGAVLHYAHGEAAVQQMLVELALGDVLGPFLNGRHYVAEIERSGDVASQVTGIIGKFGASDEVPHGAPLVIGVAGAGEDDVTVGGAQGKLGREHILPGRCGDLAVGLVERHAAGGVSDHAVVHGHVHMLALAGLAAGLQREHDAEGSPDRGDGIAHIVADHLGAAFGGASGGHPAAHTLNARVVGGPVGVGAAPAVAVAVTGYAGVHQAGIDFAEALVGVSQPAHGAGTPVVEQDVGHAQHVLEGALGDGVAQVQGHAFLVAIDAEVAGADLGAVGTFDERMVEARLVAPPRSFDLDDLGTHVGQDHGTERAGDDVGGVEDAKAVQGQRLEFGVGLYLRGHFRLR